MLSTLLLFLLSIAVVYIVLLEKTLKRTEQQAAWKREEAQVLLQFSSLFNKQMDVCAVPLDWSPVITLAVMHEAATHQFLLLLNFSASGLAHHIRCCVPTRQSGSFERHIGLATCSVCRPGRAS
jgi:hypothetical protein